ncbi:unnamed protein product [Coccothraustes coccothraustes]
MLRCLLTSPVFIDITVSPTGLSPREQPGPGSWSLLRAGGAGRARRCRAPPECIARVYRINSVLTPPHALRPARCRAAIAITPLPGNAGGGVTSSPRADVARPWCRAPARVRRGGGGSAASAARGERDRYGTGNGIKDRDKGTGLGVG